MAESGPGCRNLWVTLKSIGGSPCTDNESLLLATAEERRKRLKWGEESDFYNTDDGVLGEANMLSADEEGLHHFHSLVPKFCDFSSAV